MCHLRICLNCIVAMILLMEELRLKMASFMINRYADKVSFEAKKVRTETKMHFDH